MVARLAGQKGKTGTMLGQTVRLACSRVTRRVRVGVGTGLSRVARSRGMRGDRATGKRGGWLPPGLPRQASRESMAWPLQTPA